MRASSKPARCAIALVLGLAAIVASMPAAVGGPLTIPLGQPPGKIDGQCDPAGEWKDAIELPYPDSGTTIGHVYLKHDNVNLYVCLQGTPGQHAARFASVYLDTTDARKVFAGPTDYALHATLPSGALASFHGTGVANGYAPLTLDGWVAATSTGNADVAEYAISLALTGGWCGKAFGIAVYHHWVNGTGDDYGWPTRQYFDQPQTWGEVQLGNLSPCAGISNLAYVYRADLATASDFKALLNAAGYAVDLIPQSAITTTTFTPYHAILIADDTGNLNAWGAGLPDVTPILNANKPTLGLGEGGYAYFGQLGSAIGWPHGWHGPQQFVQNATPPPAYYYTDPQDLTGLLGPPIKLYQTFVNEVGIYAPGGPPAGVTLFGWEPPPFANANPDHAPLIAEGCRQLWGYSQGPAAMTEEGLRLFLNAVAYSRFHSVCDPLPQPPPDCFTVTKSAEPPAGSIVKPGDAIVYTVSYAVLKDANCATARAVLIDQVPDYTLFVPGSADGGAVPNFAGALEWDLSPLAIGSSGSRKFAVSVADSACRPGLVTNTGKLQTSLGIFASNATTHKVDCAPVVPPSADPPYAESEIQIYPYPLVAGRSSRTSVRITNTSAAAQSLTVTMETTGSVFGIGVPYDTIPALGNPRTLTIDAGTSAEVVLNWTPAFSGHTGIRAKLESPGFATLYTYRNFDVTEDLHPGATDVLTFPVVNPTASIAAVTLVVVNNCPGWSATVTPALIPNLGPGAATTATLSVTPPSAGPLGTGCSIDVQGWIGSQLIGGIRKLDVPPVNLPHTLPPWLEQEITTIPTVPVAGSPAQVCIELQNPLGVTRAVTVRFSEADFGAGIGLTLFSTQAYDLPPHSIATYCTDWTPAAGGTLHRCLFVQVDQDGWLPQRSQRNLDIARRPAAFGPGGLSIPFRIGNPLPFPATLQLDGTLIGLAGWHVGFSPDPPPSIGPGAMLDFTLTLLAGGMPGMPSATPKAALAPSVSGDVLRADVAVSLNGNAAGGFSVEFAPMLLDVDANGAYDPLTDGVLVIRYLFGVAGDALTAGAIGNGATRIDPAQVLEYLDGIRPALDADGNGQVDALSDGLLLLRYLRDLRGAALTAGGVGSGAGRNGTQIERYIDSMMP